MEDSQMSKIDLVIGEVPTSAGTFGALVSPQGLARLTFPGEPLEVCEQFARRWWPQGQIVPDDGRLQPIVEQLQAYFQGKLRTFSLPLHMQGTPFQQQVWAALQQVPFGQTRSYADLAASIGNPRAVRAVGRANGANPVPVIVPCHRIIGKSGKLVGYAGGLEIKQMLLELEGITLA
jgi:methylated-DNA-[protein]-cysteine S-methyltransferase